MLMTAASDTASGPALRGLMYKLAFIMLHRVNQLGCLPECVMGSASHLLVDYQTADATVQIACLFVVSDSLCSLN